MLKELGGNSNPNTMSKLEARWRKRSHAKTYNARDLSSRTLQKLIGLRWFRKIKAMWTWCDRKRKRFRSRIESRFYWKHSLDTSRNRELLRKTYSICRGLSKILPSSQNSSLYSLVHFVHHELFYHPKTTLKMSLPN